MKFLGYEQQIKSVTSHYLEFVGAEEGWGRIAILWNWSRFTSLNSDRQHLIIGHNNSL
jgi:hypothetical protein